MRVDIYKDGKIAFDAVAQPESPAGRAKLVHEDGHIDRSAFLYMEGVRADHAQCSSCLEWYALTNRCRIHGPRDFIDRDDSCGLYVPGAPAGNGPCLSLVTPMESGLVDRQVRCENCQYGGSECGLYKTLNSRLPEIFDLDTKISPKGCCNAQTPK